LLKRLISNTTLYRLSAFTTVDNPATALDATNREILSSTANDPLINLGDPNDACSPDFSPLSNSTLLTDGTSFAGWPTGGVASKQFDAVSFRGACNTGGGADATWPQQGWVKYNYPRYCVACETGTCN
jgi:hypothetical protein